MKGLNQFTFFSLEDFLADKRLVFVKASEWSGGQGKDMKIEGSKVLVQIIEDKTKYKKEDNNNFGEQFKVKVRGVLPKAYAKMRPLNTEIVISEVERATTYGDFNENLSVIAVINAKGGEA
jgi:hypothetical protein